MEMDDDLMTEFLVESNGNVEAIDQDLVELNRNQATSTAWHGSFERTGVGMDVVKNNVEAISGTLEIQSECGLERQST